MPTKPEKSKPARKAAPAAAAPSSGKARQFYSVAEPFNASGGRKRRLARIEHAREEDAPNLSPTTRLLGVNQVRDLLRNSPETRGLARTIRVNTIGPYGQIVFRDEGEWFAAAANYYNHTWAPHADFIDGTTWRECLQLVVHTIAFEGDAVVVFDDGQLSPGKERGTGRLVFFEADQIASVIDADWAEYCKRAGHVRADGSPAWHQCSGVILNELGRKCGIVVSRVRGQQAVPWRDALVMLCDPDDPDAAPWRHVTRKFRLRQLRGSADALPGSTIVQDATEMREYELQSAKRASSHYAAVLGKDRPVDPVDMAALPSPDELGAGAAPAASGESSSAAGASAPAPIPGATDDDSSIAGDLSSSNLSRVSGGQVDYYEGVEKIEWDPATRPSDRVVEFLEYATRLSGRAHGINASYASGKAEGSYTAFRGDVAMSWLVFFDNQQFIEDAFSDWVARHVLRRAIDLGLIVSKEAAPKDWPSGIRWTYPKMPAVDEQKEQAAVLAKLRNGTTTLRDELGPAWRDVIRQRAEEKKFCAGLGLVLAQDETTPGSQPTPTTESNATANE